MSLKASRVSRYNLGMAQAASGWKSIRVYLEMIKFEHSIFALPFAMIGMMWASLADHGTAWPGWWALGWIVAAMVSCRSAAMAFNRILDRSFDAANPRTQMRALPAGLLSLQQANLFLYGSCAVFVLSAAMLNQMALWLSPVALGITLFYSATKRFTPLCHYVLGLSLGIAPAAAWVAVTGSLEWTILPLVGAVALWTAGFDIIYSLQDDDFDSSQGLRSMPQTLGRERALWVSRFSHLAAAGLIAWSITLHAPGIFGWLGAGYAAVFLFLQHRLVKPDDLSRVNMAFFTMNGYISLGLMAFVVAEALL